MSKLLKINFYLVVLAVLISITYPQFGFANEITNPCLNHLSNNISSKMPINLNNCNINDNDISQLIEIMKSKKFSEQVYLENNKITSKGAMLLAQYPYPHSYNLDHNEIDQSGLMAFLGDKNLKLLGIGYNPIDNESIKTFIKKMPTTTIDGILLGNYPLDISSLNDLANNINLITLQLDGVNLGDSGVEILARSSSIISLSLANVGLSTIGLQAIAKNPHLQWLWLPRNNITDEGAAILASCNTFYQLDVRNNHISGHGFAELMRSPKIEYLYMSGNDIGNDDLSLPDNNKLNILELNNNKLGDKSITSISSHITRLNELDLNDNSIGKNGLLALAKISIHRLSLQNNHINADAITSFANSVSLKNGQMDLDLSHNQLGDAGVVALTSYHPDFGVLNLSDNGITDVGISALTKKRNGFFSLNLSNNKIGDVGAKAFSQSDLSMSDLNLAHNKISDKGAYEFADANIDFNVYFMDLSHNKIGARGIDALKHGRHPYVDLRLEGNED